MADLNTLNITDSGFLNINNKIINSRTFSKKLIKYVGSPTITDGVASDFSETSYLTYSPINFTEDTKNISVIFNGTFALKDTPQCAWELNGTAPLSLMFKNDRVYLTYDSFVIFSLSTPFKDNTQVKAYLDLKASSFKFTLNYGEEVIQKTGNLSSAITLENFTTLNIGSTSLNRGNYWFGDINLESFFIYDNGNLLYAPSDGASWSFSKILVSDGEFELSNTSTPIARHIYSFDVTEINRSGSTILLGVSLDSDIYLTIKEIGLYIKTPNGEVLFGIIKNLNVNKSKDLLYDLIFTVNIEINVVNAVGFPQEGDIVIQDPNYVLLKNFKTVQEVNTYVLTNLERLVAKNALNIGYNKAQVFYRLQQEIERNEDCYNAVDTFVKLTHTFQRIIEDQVNTDDLIIKGDLEIPTNGEITNTSEASYAYADTPFRNTDEWEVEAGFKISPNVQDVWSEAARVPNLANTGWKALTYDGTKFVALSYDGYISTSINDINWTEPSYIANLGNQDWQSLTYDGTKFMALGRYGFISTSTDGINWTEATQLISTSGDPSRASWTALSYNGNKFVALSYTGYISTSENGEEWETTYSSERYYHWTDLTYDGTKFVALSYDGYISTSTNGTEWSEAIKNSNLGNQDWQSFTYDGNKFVALSYTGYISTSEDGITWTKAIKNSNLGNHEWSALSCNGDELIALGYRGYISTSYLKSSIITLSNKSNSKPLILGNTNNKCYLKVLSQNSLEVTIKKWSWSTVVQNDKLKNYTDWNHVAYGNSIYVALSLPSGYASTSEDGTNWTDVTRSSGLNSGRFTCLTYNESINSFLAVSYDGYVASSQDGQTWQRTSYSPLGAAGQWRCVAYGNNILVATGVNGYVATATANNYTNWNVSQISKLVPYFPVNSIVYDGTKFILFMPYHVSTSEDGVEWTDPVPYNRTPLTSIIAYDGTKFISLNDSGYISTSEDGITWAVGTKDPNLGYRNFYQWTSLVHNNNDNKLLALGRQGYISMAKFSTETYQRSPINDTSVGESNYYAWQNNNLTNQYNVHCEGAEPPLQAVVTFPYSSNLKWNYSTISPNWKFKLRVKPTNTNNNQRYILGNSKTSRLFVALGEKGYISTSEDGVDWTEAIQNDNLGTRNYWFDIIYYNFKFIAISRDGYISTSEDGITWTRPLINSNLLGNNWQQISYGKNKLVALGSSGYVSTSTDGTTWTKAIQNSNLSSSPLKSWKSLTYDNTKFVALDVKGYISTSTNGLNWSEPIQISNLGYHEWRSISYGNNKFVALGYMGYVSTSEDGITWTQAVQPSNLNFYGWESLTYDGTQFRALNSRGYTSTSEDGIVWTNPIQPSNLGHNDWNAIAQKYEGDSIKLYLKNGKLLSSAYNQYGEPIFESFGTVHPLENNKTYDVTLSYSEEGYYALSYQLIPDSESDYPYEETVYYYTTTNTIIQPLYIGNNYTNANSSAFKGDINFNNSYFTSDDLYWTGASSLRTIYTPSDAPTDEDPVYDDKEFIIKTFVPSNYTSNTLISDNSVFTIERDKKYNIKLTYETTSETSGTYKVYKSEDNGKTYELVKTYEKTGENDSFKMQSPVYTYIGVTPPNDEGSPVKYPFNGTLYLLDFNIKQGESEWNFRKEVATQPGQLLQYYHLPMYNRNSYDIHDLCNFERIMRILNTKFEGNRDAIDFSDSYGFTLCLKVHLKDSENKEVIYKSNLTDDIYFNLSFINQTLTFTLNNAGNPVTISKELTIQEYYSYEAEPIMITLINTHGDYEEDTLRMYKNNELIGEAAYYPGFVEDPEAYVLSNYLENTENPQLLVSDIVVISGAISTEHLYYINNLFDTNY